MRCWWAGVLLAAVATSVPTGASAGNQEAAQRIAFALKQSGQLHNYRIAVLCQNGTVWLKGQVATQDQMNTALQLAFGVPGVGRVVNHLAVTNGDAPQAVGRPKDSPSRAPRPSAIDDAVSVPEAILGSDVTPKTGRHTPPLLRSRNPSDTLPERVSISIRPLEDPPGKAISTHRARTGASSRLPWAPDIVITGPLTPTPADLTPVHQPKLTDAAETQADSPGELRDGRALEKGVQHGPEKAGE